MAELEDRPEYCLDLTFMYSLLSLGYELAEDRTLRTGKKIDNVELGWSVQTQLHQILHADILHRALGAAIALLDGDLTCTA